MLNMLNSLIRAEEEEGGQEIMTSSRFPIQNIDQKLSKKEMLRRAQAFKKRNLQCEGIDPREKHFFIFIRNGNVFVEVVSK